VTDDEEADPPAVALWLTFAGFWLVASHVTEVAHDYGLGWEYFATLGLVFWTLLAMTLYHHRAGIRSWFGERWNAFDEPRDSDEIIDDVLDDGEGGDSS
jgi:hypothetical protein